MKRYYNFFYINLVLNREDDRNEKCYKCSIKKDETVLKISEDVEQKDIMQTLRKKLPDLRKMYKNEKIPIKVTGKALKNREMDEIQRIIQSIIDVDVDFDTPKSFGLSSIKKTFEQKTIVSETTFHRGSLRSGQKIRS